MTPEELESKTKQLDKLINKLNSGKSAYRAGEMLFEIQEKKEFLAKEYKGFGEYVVKELNISEGKAYKYIQIYKIFFDEDEISPLAKQIHLILLVNQDEDIRSLTLQQMKADDDINIKKNVNQKEPSYTENILKGTTNLLKSAKKSNIKLTTALAEKAFFVSRNFGSYKLPIPTGKTLETNEYFEEIRKIFPYEPTEESSVVALFCCMFYKLMNIPFIYKNKEFTFKFIKYFTSKESPDAEIYLEDTKTNLTYPFKVEFEHLSTNFICHGHIYDDKTYHILICWENNFRNLHLIEFENAIPPTISIKDLLKTVKVEFK